VLEYTDDLTRKFETDERVLEELKKHLGPRELVELNLTIGIAFMTNLFTKSFGIV
jgi:alkylhydroperoxidase family enzyme